MMQFTTIDTHAIYKRLLAAPDDASREAIFSDLIKPFDGLVNIFGWGKTGLDAFAGWGMSPKQFAADNHTHMVAIIALHSNRRMHGSAPPNRSTKAGRLSSPMLIVSP